ncbi:hypothetical protein [Microbacterium sp. A84]|uniref:hypothetical protein n=1 Tax=Microbacterium sp. A84 TaxID=3450715 RepID=UPI003F42425E
MMLLEQPRIDDLTAFDFDLRLQPDAAVPIWEKCVSHPWERLRGGLGEIVRLLGALDGTDASPWLLLCRDDDPISGQAFVQAIGDAREGVAVEIGIGIGTQLVGRTGAPVATVMMPADIQYWLPYVDASQLFTVAEAASLMWMHLFGGLPGGYVLQNPPPSRGGRLRRDG